MMKQISIQCHSSGVCEEVVEKAVFRRSNRAQVEDGRIAVKGNDVENSGESCTH